MIGSAPAIRRRRPQATIITFKSVNMQDANRTVAIDQPGPPNCSGRNRMGCGAPQPDAPGQHHCSGTAWGTTTNLGHHSIWLLDYDGATSDDYTRDSARRMHGG